MSPALTAGAILIVEWGLHLDTVGSAVMESLCADADLTSHKCHTVGSGTCWTDSGMPDLRKVAGP